MQSIEKDIDVHPSLNAKLYCFHLPTVTAKYTRKDLTEVGISSPWDVGDRLVDIFEKNKQQTLADELKSFLGTRRLSVDL